MSFRRMKQRMEQAESAGIEPQPSAPNNSSRRLVIGVIIFVVGIGLAWQLSSFDRQDSSSSSFTPPSPQLRSESRSQPNDPGDTGSRNSRKSKAATAEVRPDTKRIADLKRRHKMAMDRVLEDHRVSDSEQREVNELLRQIVLLELSLGKPEAHDKAKSLALTLGGVYWRSKDTANEDGDLTKAEERQILERFGKLKELVRAAGISFPTYEESVTQVKAKDSMSSSKKRSTPQRSKGFVSDTTAEQKLLNRVEELYGPEDLSNPRYLKKKQDAVEWMNAMRTCCRVYADPVDSTRIKGSNHYLYVKRQKYYVSTWKAENKNVRDLAAFVSSAIQEESDQVSTGGSITQSPSSDIRSTKFAYLERLDCALYCRYVLSLDSDPKPCEAVYGILEPNDSRVTVIGWFEYLSTYYESKHIGTSPPSLTASKEYKQVDSYFKKAGLSKFSEAWRDAIDKYYLAQARRSK